MHRDDPPADLPDEGDEEALHARGGTFTFPWAVDGAHGFGTARFGADGRVTKLLRVADARGRAIGHDPELWAKVTEAAEEFIGQE